MTLNYPKFEDILGLTLTKFEVNTDKDRIDIESSDGRKFIMHHPQDCCESVSIDQITGDIADLIGSPILKAEEATSDKNPDGVTMEYQDSFTWTFYKLATIKGYVDIRWYGESNGHYSESVYFDEVKS